MTVRINSGTIVIRISDMTVDDAGDEEAAQYEIGSSVKSAIDGACEMYRNGLSLEAITMDDVDVIDKVALVRLMATVSVALRHDDDSMSPEDWASEYGWNFLAFEAQDVDFDYTVADHDSGEEAQYDTEDSVQDPRDRMRREVRETRHLVADREAVIRRVRTILDSGNFAPGSQNVAIAALFDVELAHGLALDEYGDRAVAAMERDSFNDPDSIS